MAKKSDEIASGELPIVPNPRFMDSGDPRKDFHPKHRDRQMIDPESLIVGGKDPHLALPIVGGRGKVCVRRVAAKDAAYMLTCDPATGGQSVHRLATAEEIAAEEARQTAKLK